MKSIRAMLLLILLAPGVAFGAQIFGTLTLKEGNASVGPGLKVMIEYGGKTIESVTDKRGAYSLYVPKSGKKCKIKVEYSGHLLEYDVYSYDDPQRYDFDIVRQSDGKYILQRK